MRPFRKKPNGTYYVDVRKAGYSRIQVSTRTTNLQRAKAMVATIQRLMTLGRRDILARLASGSLKLDEVHDLCIENMTALTDRLSEPVGYSLAALVADWLQWLRLPSTTAPRTHRTYSPATIDRYTQSWQMVFAVLEKGRDSKLNDLTDSFFAEYRRRRIAEGSSAPTLNRDMAALRSFLRWAHEEREIDVPPIRNYKMSENPGRDRWLDAGEIAAARANCSDDWWVLFATLICTGMRVSEAQGLIWSNVHFDRGYIEVRENSGMNARRLKSHHSRRLVLFPDPLPQLLSLHAQQIPSGPSDRVFPDRRGNRRAAYKQWLQVIKRAGLQHCRVHDLRHTFGVHALLAGIPLPRLQRLMGHSTAAMTLRYAQHVSDSYLGADSQLFAGRLLHAESGAEHGQLQLLAATAT